MILKKSGIYHIALVQWIKKTFVSIALIYLQVTIIARKDFIVWFYLPFVIENIVLFYITFENLVVIMIVESQKNLGHSGIPDLILSLKFLLGMKYSSWGHGPWTIPWKTDWDAKDFELHIFKTRRTIENTFGIMGARWWIVHTLVRTSVENV